MMTAEKLQALLVEHDDGVLKSGSHKKGEREFCAMEFIAKIAGEPWTDSPECVHPALAAYCRTLNDAQWPDNATRTKTMLPLLAEVFGSRDLAISVSNIAIATVREIVPVALESAAACEGMPAVHAEKLREHAGKCRSANAADAAYAAADAAARYAARYAARSAARYAADAARSADAAARYAAAAADAADAARYAARSAADAAAAAANAANAANADAAYAANAATYAAARAARYADRSAAIYEVSIAIVIKEIQRARTAQ